MVKRLAERLYLENAGLAVNAAFNLGRRASASFWLAVICAAMVYLAISALVAFGTYFVFLGGENLLHALGFALLMLAWLARPRFAEVPKKLLLISEYPAMYQLVREVANRLDLPQISGIGINAEFNAAYVRAGWRGDPYIELGAPLVAVVSREELIALISHELAHGANGDPLRGKFLFGAVETVASWAIAIRPDGLGRLGDGIPFGGLISIVGIPLEICALVVSGLLLLFAKGMVMLVLRDSQRAEYLADRIGASICGGKAMQQLLEKLYLFDVVDMAIQRHALVDPGNSLCDSIERAVDEIDSQRHAAICARLDSDLWQADSSHPPTRLRINALNALLNAPATSSVEFPGAEELKAETRKMMKFIERQAIDLKLDAIH